MAESRPERARAFVGRIWSADDESAITGMDDRSRGRENRGGTVTESFREYGARVIAERLGKMLTHTRAVRRGGDVEALHDMRVASRRLRAALAIFEPAFVSPGFGRFERAVKEVTDALGEARDLDVMAGTLETLSATLPKTQRQGVQMLLDEQRDRRRDRQVEVVRALARMERLNLLTWFASIVDGTADERLAAEGGPDSVDGASAPASAPDPEGADG